MTAPLMCICTGLNVPGRRETCPAKATQEDFLCDHCRTIRCWEMTEYDPTRCMRLGCPEHTVPGGQFAAVTW